MRDYYEFLDENINTCINADVGFSCLLSSPQTYELGREECDGFFARYEKIKKFQEQTLDLFHASLKGDAHPEIAELTLNELPEHFGREFHENLLSAKKSLPFFSGPTKSYRERSRKYNAPDRRGGYTNRSISYLIVLNPNWENPGCLTPVWP